jgi:hypothetical protein
MVVLFLAKEVLVGSIPILRSIYPCRSGSVAAF